CDDEAIRILLERYELAEPTPHAFDTNQNLQSFIFWLFAHEIGHAAMHRKPSHFSANNLQRLRPVDPTSQRREHAADEFVVQRSRKSSQRLVDLQSLLIDLTNTVVRERAQ